MAVNVFDSFLHEFEQPITNFVSTSAGNLAAYINGPLRVAVMLYVILYGFAVMRATTPRAAPCAAAARGRRGGRACARPPSRRCPPGPRRRTAERGRSL